MTTKTTTAAESEQHMRDLAESVSTIAQCVARRDAIQLEIDAALREKLSQYQSELANLQGAIQAATETAETLCEMHPGWFGKAKSFALPMGTCAFRDSTKTEVPNEVLTMQRLATELPDPQRYVRTRTELDIELLERLPDDVLSRLGVVRIKTRHFSVKPIAAKLP